MFLEYFEKELTIIPLRGKIPILKSWQNFILTEEKADFFEQSYKGFNIGILLGELNKIIALDIDSDNVDVLKYAPLSPVVKRGKKGETRFFKYNGEKSIKRHDLFYEILSTGNQTVIPPSIHPETKLPYVWLVNSLLTFDLEELPTLDQDFINELNNSRNKVESSIIKSDGRRCNHGSHTKLSEMLVAKIHERLTPETIVKELLDYDSKINENISYFQCPSRKWRSNSKELNAFNFVLSDYEKHQKINLKEVKINIEIVEKPKQEYLYKRHKLPKMRGIMSDMFNVIYKGSIKPRTHAAFASVITTFSTISANKYHYRGLYSNVYTLLIMESGEGKNAYMNFCKKILSEIGLANRIGDGSPSGDTALIANLTVQPIRIDVIDEIGGKLFATLGQNGASYQRKIADVYAELFTSCGERYLGKIDSVSSIKNKAVSRIGECYNPFVNLIGATTFTDFKAHLTSDIITKGLGGRFLYFPDDEHKAKNYDFDFKIPQDLIHSLRAINYKEIIDATCTKEGQKVIKIPEIKYSERIRKKINEIDKELDDKCSKLLQGDILKPLLNRAGEYLVKLILLDTMSNERDEILADSVDWGDKTIKAIIGNYSDFIRSNVSSGAEQKLQNEFEQFILQAGHKGVTMSELCNGLRRLSLKSFQRKEIIQSLLDFETIVKKDTKFIHKTFVNFS